MPRRLPKQQRPAGIERDYARELKKLTKRTDKAIEPLLRELPTMLAEAREERNKEGGKLDAGEGRHLRVLISQAMKDVRIKTSALEALARKFAVRTQTHQRIQMGKQVRAVLGVDLTPNTRLMAIMEGFVAENVALIKDVPEKVLRDIEGIVNRGLTSGALHKDVATEIRNATSLGRKRSAFIARDQVGKYYGQVTATRHQKMGVERFTWNTVGDERVRSEHQSLNGQTFRYNEPPSEGLPGEPVLCRCYADPVLEDLL